LTIDSSVGDRLVGYDWVVRYHRPNEVVHLWIRSYEREIERPDQIGSKGAHRTPFHELRYVPDRRIVTLDEKNLPLDRFHFGLIALFYITLVTSPICSY
jgi:hypothetical protein